MPVLKEDGLGNILQIQLDQSSTRSKLYTMTLVRLTKFVDVSIRHKSLHTET